MLLESRFVPSAQLYSVRLEVADSTLARMEEWKTLRESGIARSVQALIRLNNESPHVRTGRDGQGHSI